jgi:uncharacterized protein YyaL (SSP411 family)
MIDIYKHTNKLINETSPYLLQHAHNPVNWYPWSEEALKKAKNENKPIFLSIGYSSCHWCHVMERESFTNREIADILNRDFISIKVDREERPDIDNIYMIAVMALTGKGGWPLTAFLTSDLKIFFGGTYFPPSDKYGIIGFKRLVSRISEIWNKESEKEKLILDAENLFKTIQKRAAPKISKYSHTELNKELLRNAVLKLEESFDQEWGGFGNAPKFPSPSVITFLLNDYHFTKNKKSIEMAVTTLDHMYWGGMFDHLAGGFHRYSTDRMWLLPHFEKMLYDNALLARVYSQTYSKVAHYIFNYVTSYMTDESGGFYSAEDADINGKEGLFYLLRLKDIYNVLNKKEADIFSYYYNVKQQGNFASQEPFHNGMNILHITEDLTSLSNKFSISENKLNDILTAAKDKLLKTRDKQARPFLDDKIITSWNSLMISAFSEGYMVFEEKSYLNKAENAAEFIMNNMHNKDGFLLRTYISGKSKHPAYLEDYAFFICALIDLYEADFEAKWIDHAERLTEIMVTLFWDEKKGHFNDTTSRFHKNQIIRTVTLNDSSLPSPSGAAVEALIRMGRILGINDYLEKSQKAIKSIPRYLKELPHIYMKMLINASNIVFPEKEIVLVGKANSSETKRLLKTIRARFIPNRTIVFLDPAHKDSLKLSSKIPLLENKTLIDGKSTVYVCENLMCKNPVTSPDHLNDQL